MDVALLNTTIVTSDGDFTVRTVSTETAQALVREFPVVSYVGHPDTVTLMSRILGIPVEFSRGQFVQAVGQTALCFKLNGRIEARTGNSPELTESELEAIGYTFKLMIRTV
jgi:Domain of unknown function (DUF1874)